MAYWQLFQQLGVPINSVNTYLKDSKVSWIDLWKHYNYYLRHIGVRYRFMHILLSQ